MTVISAMAEKSDRHPQKEPQPPTLPRAKKPADSAKVEAWFQFLIANVLEQKKPPITIIRYEGDQLSVEFKGLSEEDDPTRLLPLRVDGHSIIQRSLNEMLTVLNKHGELDLKTNGTTICFCEAGGKRFDGRIEISTRIGVRSCVLTLTRVGR